MVNTNGGCANHLPGPNPPYSQAPGALGGAWANRSQRVTYIKQITVSPPGETTLASTLRFPAKCSSAKICGRFTCTTADIRDRIRIAQPPVDPLPSKLSTSTSFTSSASLQRLYTLRRSWNFLPTRHSLELSCRQGVSTLAVHTTTGAAMFSNT